MTDDTQDAHVLHAGVGGAKKCGGCGAAIQLAKTVTGSLAPFERDGGGEWGIANGIAHYLGRIPALNKVALYKRHVCKESTRG